MAQPKFLKRLYDGSVVSITGPNCSLVNRSESASDKYLEWFHSHVGTVPQMMHNFYSAGWDQHCATIAAMIGDEAAAVRCAENRYTISHWGIMAFQGKQIAVPLGDHPIDTAAIFDWYRPAYDDTIRVDWLTNVLLQTFIPFTAISQASFRRAAAETGDSSGSGCIVIAGEFEEVQEKMAAISGRMSRFAQACTQMSQLVREAAGELDSVEFFQVID